MMLILLCACGTKSVDKVTSSDEVYIRKIENIPDDFIMGVDFDDVDIAMGI